MDLSLMTTKNASKPEDNELVAENVFFNNSTSLHGKLNLYVPQGSITNGVASNPSKFEPLSGDFKRGSIATDPNHDPLENEGVADSVSSRVKRRRAISNTTKSSSNLSRPPYFPPPSSHLASCPRSSTDSSSTTVTSKKSPGRRKQATPQTLLPTALTASKSLYRDTIPPSLLLLLVGVNPGLLTGSTGFAYAHPSNLFWKLLYSSGITNIRHPPSDTYKLPRLYSVGNTNLVERPTRDASMLRRAEMDEGVPVLEAKVMAQRPQAVCLVGKGIWEAVWRVRHGREIHKEEFHYGWQSEEENMGRTPDSKWDGAPVFVATTTSGLAAGMRPAEKEAIWAELGSWVVRKREERALSSV
ncbi:DNA glycosylase, G/T mismatch [Penicillium italicum]|uniref:DNA glycosylase, G/T mismatch n=1 Tax=Penicillium italicum TaxID=40296 RepID=A0A0A2KNE3_PENIT|nr:DNA glycosylase, G/T mismatch [Penicillium italicum]